MNPTPTDDNDEAAPPPDPENQDSFLRLLVGAINKTDTEVALTLSVGGLLISGMACSSATYFDGLGNDLVTGAEGNEAQSDFGAMFRQWAEEFRQSPNTDDDDDDERHWDVRVIHMKDARFFAPGQVPLPNNRGIHWRGRLSSVDGFSMGQLRAELVSG